MNRQSLNQTYLHTNNLTARIFQWRGGVLLVEKLPVSINSARYESIHKPESDCILVQTDFPVLKASQAPFVEALLERSPRIGSVVAEDEGLTTSAIGGGSDVT